MSLAPVSYYGPHIGICFAVVLDFAVDNVAGNRGPITRVDHLYDRLGNEEIHEVARHQKEPQEEDDDYERPHCPIR